MSCSLLDTIRGPKILNMSIFDWVASLAAAFLVGYYGIGIRSYTSWGIFIVAWILLGVVVHVAAGVPTMLGYYLGLNEKPARKAC